MVSLGSGVHALLTEVVCSKCRDQLCHVRVGKLGKEGVERVKKPRAANFADVGVRLQRLELPWHIALEPTQNCDDAELTHPCGLLNTKAGLLVKPPQGQRASVRWLQVVPSTNACLALAA
jgi:hypothetical protein